MVPWLKELLPKKLLKDLKDLMSNTKFANNNTKLTKKVNNCLDFSAKNILTL